MTLSRGLRRRQVAREDGCLCCIDCNEWKPPEDFHRDRDKRSGRATRCKACSLARHRVYYEQNRERIVAHVQARRAEDVEAARVYERQVYQRRRAKHQATNRARERKMKPLNRESLDYEAVLKGDPCSYCGGRAEQIDHIDPVAIGGENHWTNLASACWPCNRSKSDKPLLLALGS